MQLRILLLFLFITVGCDSQITSDLPSIPPLPVATPSVRILPPAPVLSQIVPSIGHRHQSTPLRILGSHFQPGATVSMGGRAFPVTFVSSEELRVTLIAQPEAALAAVIVSVQNPEGQRVQRGDLFRFVLGRVLNLKSEPKLSEKV